MIMIGLTSPNRQNTVPDRTENSIHIHPKTADCEYCHTYEHDEFDLKDINDVDFYNDDKSSWGNFVPGSGPMSEDILIIRMNDMKLYYSNDVIGLSATGATHCPMCGRKLREDV